MLLPELLVCLGLAFFEVDKGSVLGKAELLSQIAFNSMSDVQTLELFTCS